MIITCLAWTYDIKYTDRSVGIMKKNTITLTFNWR